MKTAVRCAACKLYSRKRIVSFPDRFGLRVRKNQLRRASIFTRPNREAHVLYMIVNVRDAESCHVVVREDHDHYYVEVPNAEHDGIWQALHFCDLLPVTMLKVRG